MLEHALAFQPDVCVVVHSSWRMHLSNNMLREILGDLLAQRFIGITSRDLGRRAGIEDFVKRSQVEQFVVIDDDRKAFGHFEQLVFVDPELGLSDYAAYQRITTWLAETAPSSASASKASYSLRL